MTLDEARAHIGHGVVYLKGTDRAEYGVITSLTTLPTAKAGGFRPSQAGVPVSQPTANGRTRAVLHQLRRHQRRPRRLRQDLPQGCSSPR